MNNPVYLDYAATTPADPRVIKAMNRHLGPTGIFGNPSSYWHRFGQDAGAAVEQAREHVALFIHAYPDEVIWTSGATESDNLALKGVSFANAHHGRHIITSQMEHKAILDSCEYLERQGFEVTYLNPSPNGLIVPQQVLEALRRDTILVSLMHVNNELGTITDIDSISAITCKYNILFHTDAAQSVARLPLDTSRTNVDLISLSGHKMYGPKGIGALYVRRSSQHLIHPQIHGGGHEAGLRSGTLPTHQIVGMGEAARILGQEFESDRNRIAAMSRNLVDSLRKIKGASVNADRRHCVPDILNISFAGVESESLIMMLKDIAISTGSACTSASIEPSHVLKAMSLDEDAAFSSVRLSLGRFTTDAEIALASFKIAQAVRELQAVSFSLPEQVYTFAGE